MRRTLWLVVALLPLLLLAATSCNSGKSNPAGPGAGSELDSGVLGPGGVFQHTFANAGTYGYHCVFHAPMRGTVQVSATATDSVASVSITSSTTTFPGATVRPGGKVVWTNNTVLDHTVTSN
jgi:plastocyanin